MGKKVKKVLEKKTNIKIQIILSIIFSIGFFLVSLGLSYYIFAPKIEVKNKETIIVRVNDTYKEPGIKINSPIKNNYSKLLVINNLDTSKVGTYRIYYKINSVFGENIRFREVKVIDDIKPVIKLIGEDTVKVCRRELYVESGYTATDNYDGDLTDKVVIENASDRIIYLVKDSSGNIDKVTRKIIIEDAVKPTITLKGYSHYYMKLNDTYNEAGYIVSDNCGDVSNNVTIAGNVSTDAIGTYTLTYTVKDYNNNANSIERKVTVYNPSSPNYQSIYRTNTIYLTFDDGPSGITSKVLDILKEEGVKATFFIVNKGEEYDYIIRRAYDEGHTIALHSASHNYGKIYSSPQAYFDDLNTISNVVKRVTGTESKIIRFPGGSSNTTSRGYYPGIMTILTNEVLSRGYLYYDWNVDSMDSSTAKTSTQVYYNVVNNLSHNRINIVLMHDFENNYKTLNALRDIINFGKANGYAFAPITLDVPIIRHDVKN